MLGLLLAALGPLWSQDHDADQVSDPAIYTPYQFGAGIAKPYFGREPSLGKLDVDVDLGTSFTTDLRKGFSFSTYASPEIKYRTGKRFTLRGGISLTNTEYHNTVLYSPYGFVPYSGNITQGVIYAGGDYMLGPRLFISGLVYKEFSIDHSGTEQGLNPAFDGKGLMMNVRFMPTDHMTIDAGIELYQGNNPYRTFFRDPFYRPFGPVW